MAIKKEITNETIEEVKKLLKKLPKKETASKTITEALDALKPAIQAAIDHGYSRAEIIALAAEKGLEVKGYQLTSLLKKSREKGV